MNGQRVKYGQCAEATAEYLAEKQWSNQNETESKVNPPKVMQTRLRINKDYITLAELNRVIKKLKKHKAPGPDTKITELFKWLDTENRESLLFILNFCWSEELFPDDVMLANVASIFKKGDTKKLENYRPISFLNTFFKITATAIQMRLSSKVDKHIQRTQYGFRASRSTAQALYLARRTQYLSELSGMDLCSALLDWEKAFGKIDQSRMAEALQRLRIPPKYGKSNHCILQKTTVQG